MSNVPPGTPPPIQPRRPQALDYGQPVAPRNNQWWKVVPRIFAGLAGGVGSAVLGAWLASATDQQWLFFVPPGILFGALLFVTIKYRRFGYITGLVLAPFVIAVGLFITLLIICGNLRGK